MAPALQDACLLSSTDVPCNGADEGMFHFLRRDALPSAQVLAWLVGGVGNCNDQVQWEGRWFFEVVSGHHVDGSLAHWYARCCAEKQVLGKKLTPTLYLSMLAMAVS